MMKIVIFGGTGSIGRALVKTLQKHSFEIFIVTRNQQKAARIFQPNINIIQWNGINEKLVTDVFTGNYAIVNLAGENIGAKIWSKKQKAKILNSRISLTSRISEIVNSCKVKPAVFIQASATGYYGSSPDAEFDENSPQGQGFLADVCAQWENALELIDKKSTRVIFIRTGLVLENNEGLIAKMKTAFRFFTGGHFGNGKQWMSWIHIQDEVNAISFLLKNDQTQGTYNLVAPKPERMRKFCNIFGAIQFRLSWFHMPEFIVKLLPGGMGEELLLASQKVKPAHLLEAGYEFRFEKLEDALRDLLIPKNNE